MMGLTTSLTVILVIFYLYLLVRWQYVKRPWCYMFGVVGIALLLAGRIFGISRYPQPQHWGVLLQNIFNVVGLLVAFKGAVGACYGAKLPVWDAICPPKEAEEPAPPSA